MACSGEYNPGDMVDGYGFATTICPHCNSAQNYRGVLGTFEIKGSGGTMHYNDLGATLEMAANMEYAREGQEHSEDCASLWQQAVEAGKSGQIDRFRELCLKGQEAGKVCFGCLDNESSMTPPGGTGL